MKLSDNINLRPVTEADCDVLFAWANDAETRKNSFSSDPIPYEMHVDWFSKKMMSPTTYMLMAECKNSPVGLIRFEVSGTVAELSFVVARGARGQGVGSFLLRFGRRELLQLNPAISVVTGKVKYGNIPSIKAFEKAGFGIKEQNTDYIEFEITL